MAEVDEDPEARHGPPVQPTTSALHTQSSAVSDKNPSSPRLDLNAARVSLVLELVAYTMMATADTGTMFTVYTVLGSLGAGFTPAVQSLALGIYAGRGGEETGKLFGGLSVVQVLGYVLFVIRSGHVSLTWCCAVVPSSPQCFSGSRSPGRSQPSPRRCSSSGLRPSHLPFCALFL